MADRFDMVKMKVLAQQQLASRSLEKFTREFNQAPRWAFERCEAAMRAADAKHLYDRLAGSMVRVDDPNNPLTVGREQLLENVQAELMRELLSRARCRESSSSPLSNLMERLHMEVLVEALVILEEAADRAK